MHRKDYIVVKDRHPRISEVLNDCVNLCVPACKNEPLSSILQKICGKLTEAIADIAAVEAEVDELQAEVCPTLSTEDGNIIECREDGLYATVEESQALRFGVSGEDDVAGEDRIFDITGFYFEVHANANNTTMSLSSGGTSDNFYLQVMSPDAGGTMGYFDMLSQDGGTSELDIYFQDDTGNNWSEVIITPQDVNIYSRYTYIRGGNETIGIEVTEDVNTGFGNIFLSADNGTGQCYIDIADDSGAGKYIDIFVNGIAGTEVDMYLEPDSLYFSLGTTAEWTIDGIIQDDTAPMILALDGSNNVKWIDADSFGGGTGDLQAVTDIGNTTDNQIISSVLDSHAFLVEREGVQFGVGFTIEAGGTGWGGTYLGGSMEYTPSINSDKANIYIGVNPGQGRVPGGEFDMMIGYQAGLGHNGSDYKFYLAQGSSNHLMYGDFYTGDLWIKSRVRIGQTFDGTGPTVPADPEARLDIVAGSTTIAPLKFTAGTNLTTPINGTVEFDGANLYITIAGVRRTIALVP